MFRVCQKVVCIKRGKWTHLFGWEIVPQLGVIYTVRSFNEHGLLLAEIVNPMALHFEGLQEPRWYETRFRPVVERKTDISIFTKMLTGKRENINA